MKIKIQVLTPKFSGAILKKHGYKLRNMPVHMRCGYEDNFNKYEKEIIVDSYNHRSEAGKEVSATQEILKENCGWFESPGIELGCRAMASIRFLDSSISLWKK